MLRGMLKKAASGLLSLAVGKTRLGVYGLDESDSGPFEHPPYNIDQSIFIRM